MAVKYCKVYQVKETHQVNQGTSLVKLELKRFTNLTLMEEFKQEHKNDILSSDPDSDENETLVSDQTRADCP